LETWPPAGHRLMFGDLPYKDAGGKIEVVSTNPHADADRLLRAFVRRACRRPTAEADIARFAGVVHKALDAGVPFTDALIAGYSAVLCSPGFVCLEERPGRLDDDALASRLSYFLWNSPPDDELRGARLSDLAVLRAQASRMIDDPKSRRFVDAFIDYWLDL